ncbi:MAG: GNAT family N-acetyltransferase [Anaerolineae bacterium]|jgi:hypothetical protein|nr:GNAT family N-acetyltransferase [Anaerolineae bacterium]
MTYEPITLNDGLILRAASADDIEAIASFNAHLHCPDDIEGEGEMIAQWTRDIARPNHPTAGDPALFTLVEDPAADNKIVSTMCIIPQTWQYGGVPFKFVRPEIVGTLDEYRKRGLVKAQFDWHHRWCDDNGCLVQGITGIPYFYRQFGYEYALNLDGAVRAFELQLPLKVEEGQPEPCKFRDAALEDIPFLMQCDRAFTERNSISVPRDAACWAYELEGMHTNNIYYRRIVIITTNEEEPIGFYIHPGMVWGTSLTIGRFEMMPGQYWAKMIPAVLRDAWKRGVQYAAEKEGGACKSLRLTLGENHPAHSLLSHWFKGEYDHYGWYLRVSDLPKFIETIAPALEKRLENSLFHGYSGELKLNFYKDGLKVTFDGGKIVSAAAWRESGDDRDSARFPELTFYQLLFGYRSLKELHHIYPDTYARDEEHVELLKVLFPTTKNEELWSIA